MRVLTIIPTYNELESLPKTLQRLRTAVPASDVLVVDDNSPDGTGRLADGFAAEDQQVHAGLACRGQELVDAVDATVRGGDRLELDLRAGGRARRERDDLLRLGRVLRDVVHDERGAVEGGLHGAGPDGLGALGGGLVEDEDAHGLSRVSGVGLGTSSG